MNQPDLGLKVSELCQQKGLTQEQLAERCEVCARTIQRIEIGEVDPRAYAIQCLSEVLDFDFSAEHISNEKLWLTALHLNSIFSIVIIPLLLWSWKKNQSYKIDKQGRQVINFQIIRMFLLFAALFLMLVGLPAMLLLADEIGDVFLSLCVMLALFSIFPFILIGLFTTFQDVVNAMRVLSDNPIHYVLSIPFVK